MTFKSAFKHTSTFISFATMATPKRSNRTNQPSTLDRMEETKTAGKGGKWWWKKHHQKPTGKSSVSDKNKSVKLDSKEHSSKDSNPPRKVHFEESTNGSVEVVRHNKARQTMERTLASKHTVTMATAESRPKRECSNDAPATAPTTTDSNQRRQTKPNDGNVANKSKRMRDPTATSMDQHIQCLEQEIDQLNRKLEVFKKQNENQTKELTTLRSENVVLHAKLGETTTTKDWLESEFDTTRRQLIAMSAAKKKVDQKLAMELEKSAQVDEQPSVVGDKENNKPLRSTKLSRMKINKQFLAHKHQKTARVLTAKSM